MIFYLIIAVGGFLRDCIEGKYIDREF